MVKIKLFDIVEAERAIHMLLPEEPSPRFGYRAQKIIRKLQGELRDFNEARDKIIREHGSYDNEAGQWSVDKKKQKNWEAFLSDMKNLLETEVELDIPVFKLSEIEQEGIKPAVDVYVGLWFIFEDDSPDNSAPKK